MTEDATRERAVALARQGRNKIQGLVGPMPDAAVNLRRAYLNWHDEVEQFLVEIGKLRKPELEVLHGARHRDLVKDVVPPDALWREIRAERDIGLRLLDELASPEAKTARIVGSSGEELAVAMGKSTCGSRAVRSDGVATARCLRPQRSTCFH